MAPYILAEYEQVKGEGQYPSYEDVISAVEQAAFQRAQDIWPGFEPGGVMPGAGQFGIGPLRKNDMSNDTTDSTPSGSYTFQKTISATGWQDLFNFTVRDNTLLAFAGFKFIEPTLRIIQMRIEIGDRRFPIWDLQEALSYDKFSIVLKEDQGAELIAPPRDRVLVRGYAISTGTQTVVPLGLHLFRNLAAVLTET